MPTEVADGLWLLDLGWMPPFASNGYLLDAGGELTLVDAGLPWNRNDPEEELAALGRDVADLDRILLTHYDVDHVGGVSRLHPEFDGPVYMGAADVALLTGEDDPPWTHHKGLFHRGARFLFGIDDGVDLRPVEEGDRIDGFEAFHTPGHNPGHTVYVHESGVGFLGDLVWEEDGMLTPPFWLDSYDMRDVRESIRALIERVPPFEVAAMGHGDPIRSGGRNALIDLAARL
jgi:glyoxylase-like metal-dependent hydrolase (beta-lactamase superfamily II)